MIQLERSMIHKWIIDKNVNSKVIITEFTALLSNAPRGFNFDELVPQTITQGRANSGSTITIGVRLLQSCFYMFGYSTNLEDGRKIFMPSPMSLNILSKVSPEQEANNYLVNLFSMQYPHPFDWTPQCFKIYFGRLIIKLLLEDRIDNKLFIDECIWFLPFIETITNDKYEELYDKHFDAAFQLMLSKNHDYGEAWRDMKVSTFTDMLLMRILRIKQIEEMCFF
jgi:hypothetical protein